MLHCLIPFSTATFTGDDSKAIFIVYLLKGSDVLRRYTSFFESYNTDFDAIEGFFIINEQNAQRQPVISGSFHGKSCSSEGDRKNYRAEKEADGKAEKHEKKIENTWQNILFSARQ